TGERGTRHRQPASGGLRESANAVGSTRFAERPAHRQRRRSGGPVTSVFTDAATSRHQPRRPMITRRRRLHAGLGGSRRVEPGCKVLELMALFWSFRNFEASSLGHRLESSVWLLARGHENSAGG